MMQQFFPYVDEDKKNDDMAKEILKSDLSDEMKIEVLKKILKQTIYIPTYIEQPQQAPIITYRSTTGDKVNTNPTTVEC